jgi:hypothetical protein
VWGGKERAGEGEKETNKKINLCYFKVCSIHFENFKLLHRYQLFF